MLSQSYSYLINSIIVTIGSFWMQTWPLALKNVSGYQNMLKMRYYSHLDREF